MVRVGGIIVIGAIFAVLAVSFFFYSDEVLTDVKVSSFGEPVQVGDVMFDVQYVTNFDFLQKTKEFKLAEKAEIDNFFPEIVRPKAANVGPQIGSTFGKAYKRGVKIAFGTDAGVQAHGTNWKEFVYMTQYGMEPMDAIASATIETAKLLGEFDRLGSISVGKIADK